MFVGETWQATLDDGSNVYFEQISHHPPVSAFQLIGPGKSPAPTFLYARSEYPLPVIMRFAQRNTLTLSHVVHVCDLLSVLP